MIELAEAVRLVRETAQPLPTDVVALAHAVGLVLAEPIHADLDVPPFDKSMMDGFAFASSDLRTAQRKFPVIDCVIAGAVPRVELRPGTAIQIMTGAALPRGADAVVMLEETEFDSTAKEVTIRAEQVHPGQNILRAGSILRRGDRLYSAGHRITANDVGLLAEGGAATVRAFRRPTVAVVATGNEICPPDQTPAGGQIRNSNGPLLLALALAHHALPLDLGAVEDDAQKLEDVCYRGLATDMLILTGGVSAGMMDLVPQVLQAQSVKRIFHKVSLKPGKPVWFGVYQAGEHRCLVFGLPGNPVSSFVCFHLLVREALAVLSGQIEKQSSVGSSTQRAYLSLDHEIRGDRPTYWPSQLSIVDGRAIVEPLSWKGSADQRCLSRANCLAVFPDGNRNYPANSLLEIHWLN